MPIYKSNSITITDSLDNVNLEVFISSNMPQTQVLSNGRYSPSWETTPLVLTPSVYIRNQLLPNPNIVWQRRSGGLGFTPNLVSGESVNNGILTVNKDILAADENKIITYRCIVTYGEISRYAEISFSLNILGSNGKDGSSVSIKGTAYTSETSYVIGSNYTLYSDSGKTSQITGASSGDAYLVGGYLFVYAGSSDNKFNCVGNIKGVGITSIDGPVTEGLKDRYTINYSDGTTYSYEITNGASVRSLELHASKYVVAYDSNGNLKNSEDIILTAYRKNFNTTVSWTASEGVILNGTGDIRTIPANIFNNIDSAQISVNADGLSDTVTIVKIQDGAEGNTGKSVFVTYNDSESTPSSPTGNGTSGGWHTDLTENSIWMSQKVSYAVTSGTWGVPIRIKGIDGNGIANISVTYQVSDSGASAPTGAWLPNLPSVIPGKYLWTRTITTFTDGSSVTSYNVAREGIDGEDGKGIKNTEVTYQAGTSGTAAPAGSWSAIIPSVAANQYLWTRTVLTYTDNTTSTSYSVGRIGASGVDGYTVILTNENHVFAGSTNAAISGNTTCNVVAYKGAAQVPSTIGAIQGAPAGMNITVSNNGTLNTLFTVSVTTSMKTQNGSIIVPVTVDGKTFNKVFSYSISFKGATGTSSVLFKIYSDTGFIFHNEDDMTLRLQKLYGANNIAISGTTKVQWSKLVNGEWTNTWKYDSGDDNTVPSTGETLVIKSSEVNGSQLYRCVLTYGGKTYSDIVTISDKSDVYQSRIIGIGGNILHGGELGITAYASLYHGANEEDALKCPIYSEDITPVANQAYYVLENNSYVIKKYVNNAWVADSTIQQDHMYSWFIVDKYTGGQQSIGSGKVIYITNETISKSGIIQCKIDDISVCTESFADANDPIIGSEQPSVNIPGQLWLNTDDGILYAYRETSASWEPVNSGQNRTYVSAPIIKYDCCFYKRGDLWIVGDNDEAYTDAKPGTLLIAVNGLKDGAESWDAATWKDRLAVDWDNKLYYDEALNSISDYQQKLSAYMNFEVDGLKIGANNTEFYTKVTPYDLGFYQGPEKVAYVSNKKMYNTSLEVSNDIQIAKHKSDDQPNPQKPYLMLGNFKFIIEENGSMSIARALMTAPQPRVREYGISGNVITIYFTPWSSNTAYGYKSSHDSTAINNIRLLAEDGTVLEHTTATGAGYIRVTASDSLPKTIRVFLPEHVVYNIGQSNSDYDLTNVGNDTITLSITNI